MLLVEFGSGWGSDLEAVLDFAVGSNSGFAENFQIDSASPGVLGTGLVLFHALKTCLVSDHGAIQIHMVGLPCYNSTYWLAGSKRQNKIDKLS